MAAVPRWSRSTPSLRLKPLVLAFLVLFTLWAWRSRSADDRDVSAYQVKYPLTWKHVQMSRTRGGAWFIPPEWLRATDSPPRTILEAAHFTAALAAREDHHIAHSNIPLIIHQTWKNTQVDTWTESIAEGVEKWLTYATRGGNESMAYFLWLDEGCEGVVESEPSIRDMVEALPLKVEKSDVFRVLVLNLIGGVYGDIDTLPLRSPSTWLTPTDLQPWIDPLTTHVFGPPSSHTPISLLLGIEGDNRPDTDSYWRMGYNFPVQLTQWALASAPNHPILRTFIRNFEARVKEVSKPFLGDLVKVKKAGVLGREDPLKLTGPEAITVAAREWLGREAGLRWDSLSGLDDGGKSKAVGDTIIFPITAFSPGRPKLTSMGSKSLTHPDARVWHRAQGSWKQINLKVEFGKFCRTVFGGCRDWSKAPQGR